MAAAVKSTPSYLEPVFIGGYTLLFQLFAGKVRRNVMANLRVIHPQDSSLALYFKSMRVFWNFAWMMTDSARAREVGDCCDWEIEGEEEFQKITELPTGALVLTAHMGNYDLAAPLFSSRFKKKLNAVRVPEREEEQQKWLEEKLADTESESFKVQYNSFEGMLGASLANALNQNEVVAIQGDRILYSVVPIQGEICGHSLAIPKGPFILALTTQVPVFPLFVVRMGRRRYRIIVRKPIACRRIGRDKQAGMERAVEEWCHELEAVAKKYWYQWYVFEDLFKEKESNS